MHISCKVCKGSTGLIEFTREKGGPRCYNCWGVGYITSHILEINLANRFDGNSVYMGGPSSMARRKAQSFVEDIRKNLGIDLPGHPIFVFGSNLSGIHGAGAALTARNKHFAEIGRGKGLTGNSYAIPTKDEKIKTLPLDQIETHVKEFLKFTQLNPNMSFQITAIGCGLAGYKPKDIAPFFKGYSSNCHLPPEFQIILEKA